MHNKKLTAAASCAAAGLVLLGSTAYACTAYLGTFTVKGDAPQSQEVTATGLDVSDHTYAINENNTWSMDQTVSGTFAKASAINGSVRISTGVAPNGSKLWRTNPRGALVVYDINYYNSDATVHQHGPTPFGTFHVGGPGYTTHDNWHADCMSPFYNEINEAQGFVHTPGTVAIGQVTVDENGVAEGSAAQRTFALPASNPDSGTQESAVCISDKQAYWGNQAPVTIVGGIGR